MGVKVNKVDETTVGEFDSKLWTGRAKMKVIGINPSQSELQGEPWNYKQEKPPVYTYKEEKSGVIKQIISISVEAEVGTEEQPEKKVASISLFITPELMESTYIDAFGNFGNDVSKLDGPSARKAWKGEVDLVRFIQNWVGTKKGETCSLDTIEAIATQGDITELQDIFAAAKDNKLYGLLFVREGKYQDLYKNGFERLYSRGSEFTHKQLAKEWNEIKGDFGPIDPKIFKQSDFAIREYKSNGAAASKPAGSAPAATTAPDPLKTPKTNTPPPSTTQPASTPAPATTAVDPNEPPF